jgi:hypothetical protein
MDRSFAKYLIKELKTELPVPPETCPVIDDVIKTLKPLSKHYDFSTVFNALEQVRQDNRALRDLGREWYQLADDLAHQFPTKETK